MSLSPAQMFDEVLRIKGEYDKLKEMAGDLAVWTATPLAWQEARRQMGYDPETVEQLYYATIAGKQEEIEEEKQEDRQAWEDALAKAKEFNVVESLEWVSMQMHNESVTVKDAPHPTAFNLLLFARSSPANFWREFILRELRKHKEQLESQATTEDPGDLEELERYVQNLAR